MRTLVTSEQKDNEIKYERYKKLIRNLRRGEIENINSKKTSNNITKK